MSSVAAAAADDDDYEHWPSDDQLWSEKAAPAAARGYDSNNGLQRHAYMYLPAKAPSSPKTEPAPAPALPAAPVGYPQPFYYLHGFPPQYHTYPTQGLPQQPFCYPAPQGYYTYAAAPTPVPVPREEKKKEEEEEKKPHSGANFHVYHPAYPESKAAMPQANAWLGRTRKEIEEDDMRLAKQEGANVKRKIAPIGVGDDQLFWVMDEKNDAHLRTFREIKDMVGSWEKDPRNDSYYFLLEKEKDEKK